MLDGVISTKYFVILWIELFVVLSVDFLAMVGSHMTEMETFDHNVRWCNID